MELASFINACYQKSYYKDKKDWLTKNGFQDSYNYPPEDFEYVRYFFKYNDPVLIKRIKPCKRYIHDPPNYSSLNYYTPILVRKNDTITINGKTMTGTEFMNMQNEKLWHVRPIVGGETRAIYNENYEHEIVTDSKAIQEYEDRMKPNTIIFNRKGSKVIDIWNIEKLRY